MGAIDCIRSRSRRRKTSAPQFGAFREPIDMGDEASLSALVTLGASTQLVHDDRSDAYTLSNSAITQV